MSIFGSLFGFTPEQEATQNDYQSWRDQNPDNSSDDDFYEDDSSEDDSSEDDENDEFGVKVDTDCLAWFYS